MTHKRLFQLHVFDQIIWQSRHTRVLNKEPCGDLVKLHLEPLGEQGPLPPFWTRPISGALKVRVLPK